MTPDELRTAAGRITWFHSMDLGHGVVTRGIDADPAARAKELLPADLTGMSVLDVGAWDGFFSFEAERRGASRVLAVDSFSWSGEGWGTKNGFELARRALGSRVEDQEVEVLDLAPERVGTFDVVFFLGVLYHMRHPLLALERVASVTRELLVLETHVDLGDVGTPAMAFYPGTELNGDPSNWWGPNEAGLRAMLADVGFRSVETVWELRVPVDGAPSKGWLSRRGSAAEPRLARVAVHARK